MDNRVNESNWVSENVKFVFDEVGADAFSKFETGFDDYFQKIMNIPEEEWQNMPDFNQKKENVYQTILIHFDTKNDIDKFSKLINQNITSRTNSLRIPYRPVKHSDSIWKDES